jgi:hypothetical protein
MQNRQGWPEPYVYGAYMVFLAGGCGSNPPTAQQPSKPDKSFLKDEQRFQTRALPDRHEQATGAAHIVEPL